ncbi:MAG: DUF1501 domain-containing protein [Deltaproteobacteria bacterium]|nr:DUF1501 domain-containing protein [Deltaproteobacteria bacterium]
MHRRSFLHCASLATAAVVFGPRRAHAQAGLLPPLFISIEANQAWDTTTSIDPHGHPSFSTYTENQILEVGGLRVAPSENNQPFRVRRLRTGDEIDFFAENARFLRVINGVDHRTVSHDIGPRHAFSGSLREGFPAIGALVAAVQGPNAPLAFLSTGGFDDTQGIVTLTRSGRQNILRELARPNTSAGLTTNPTFLSGDVDALVKSTQGARDARRANLLATRKALAKARNNHAALTNARGAEDAFLELANVLDATPATNDPNTLISAAGLVLAGMRSEPVACTSAHLSFGNFDTHADHDDLGTGHRARMQDLLEGIAHLIDEVENNPANAALRTRGVLVYVSSDFGRTAYNGGDDEGASRGKDHWPVTSAMLIGLGSMAANVGGGTAIGKTTPFIDGVVQPGLRATPVRIDANGNLQSAATANESGAEFFPLTATEVNFALRDALRLDEEVPPAGVLRQVDRFALPEVDARFVATIAAGRNPLLKDA